MVQCGRGELLRAPCCLCHKSDYIWHTHTDATRRVCPTQTWLVQYCVSVIREVGNVKRKSCVYIYIRWYMLLRIRGASARVRGAGERNRRWPKLSSTGAKVTSYQGQTSALSLTRSDSTSAHQTPSNSLLAQSSFVHVYIHTVDVTTFIVGE